MTSDDMVSVSTRLPPSLIGKMDEIISDRGYTGRSEFVRESIRNNIHHRMSMKYKDILDFFVSSGRLRPKDMEDAMLHVINK